ncbi:MAG: BlaI/MecI/CopY family transcriptional regulator [bacterium]
MGAQYSELGRRERQIMDVLFRHGRATAAEVLKEIADPPSYSSVRSMLRLLEEKGYVRHKWAGPRYVYVPTGRREQVQRSAARHMLSTFFNDSMESAVSAMLGATENPPSEEELDRLAQLIERAKRKGGRP